MNLFVTSGSGFNNKESTAVEISSSAAPLNKGSCHFFTLVKKITIRNLVYNSNLITKNLQYFIITI